MSAIKCKWIIRADEPYRGSTLSLLLPDGTVAYNSGATLEEYEKRVGFKCKVITEEELMELDEGFEATLITKPKRITEERFWEMMEILPPCRMQNRGGFNTFHVSEPLHGNLVSWFAGRQGRREGSQEDYFEFTDKDNITEEALCKKLREIKL